MKIWIMLLAIICPVFASDWPGQPHEHWIGMFPESFNEKADDGKKWEIEIYEESNRDSPPIGSILIEFHSENGYGPGFTAKYQHSESDAPLLDIEPHLYDRDWGYGPYFHLTILDRKNDLIEINFSEKIGPVWGDFVAEFTLGDIAVESINRGSILNYEKRSIYVEHIDPDNLVIREEQEVDVSCGNDSLRYATYETELLAKKDWIDSSGVSNFRIKYTRGC